MKFPLYKTIRRKTKILLFVTMLCIEQSACLQNSRTDGVKTVETAGVFEGKPVEIGFFHRESVYMINEYYIRKDDLPHEQAASLLGKRVLVRGILKIVKGYYGPVKYSTDGKIYEPLKEPDRMFIIKPQFIILRKQNESL